MIIVRAALALCTPILDTVNPPVPLDLEEKTSHDMIMMHFVALARLFVQQQATHWLVYP
jgi:hypothetical protein